MATRRLSLVLDLNSGQFTTRITDATGKLKTFSNVANQANTNVNKLAQTAKHTGGVLDNLNKSVWKLQLTLYSVTFLFGGLATGLIKTNAEAQKTLLLLQGMSKEMDTLARKKEALKNFEYLIDLSKQAPYSLSALTDSFVKFKSAGLDPTNGSMRALVDSVAAFGGSEDQLHRASIAIQQMSGKGVVSMEELRQQLGEAVPQAIALMARSMGMTVAQLSKQIEQGNVAAGPALRKMFLEMERTFGGSSARMMESFSGQMAKTKTNLQQLALAIGGFTKDGGFVKGGLMDSLTNGAKDLNSWLSDPATIKGAREFGTTLAGLIKHLADFAKWCAENAKTIKLLAQAFIAFKSIQMVAVGFRTVATAATVFSTTLASMSSVLKIVTGSKMTFLRGLITLRGGLAAGSLAARALQGGLLLLRIAFIAMTGPIGLIVGLIGLVAAAWYSAADAAAKYDEISGRVARGNSTKDDLDYARKQAAWYNGVVARDDKEYGRADAEGRKIMDPFGIRQANRDKAKRWNAAVAGANAGQQQNANDRGYSAGLGVYDASTNSQPGQAWQRQYDRMGQESSNLRAQGKTKEADAVDQRRFKGARAFNSTLIAGLRKKETDNVNAAKAAVAAAKAGKEKDTALERLAEAEGRQKGVLTDLSQREKDLAVALKTDELSGKEFFVSGKPKGVGGDKEPKKSEAQKLAERNLKRSETITSDISETAEEQSRAARDTMAQLAIDAVGTSGEVEKFARKLEAMREEATRLNPALKAGSAGLKELDANIASATEDFRIATLAASMRDLKDETLKLGMVSENRFARAWDGYNQEIAALQTEREEIQKIQDLKTRADQTKVLDDNIAAKTKAAVREMSEGLEEETRTILEGLANADQAREAAYQREVERVMNLTDISRIAEGERYRYAELFAQRRQEMLAALAKQNEEAEAGPARRMRNEWEDTTTRMKEVQGAWMNDFTDQMLKGELTFGGFMGRILVDYLTTIAKAKMAAAMESGMNALGGLLSNTLGSWLGAGTTPAQVPVAMAHTGAIGSHASMYRMADPALFKHAPKFHAGKMPGMSLGSHEMAAIIRKDEGVFTPEQMKALGSGASRGTPNIQVNVINESGIGLDAQQGGMKFDGQRYVVDILVDAISRPGKARNAVLGAR